MKLRKHTPAMVVIIAILITASCQEDKSLQLSNTSPSTSQTKPAGIGNRITDYTFDGTEGDAIALDVASRWISNYLAQNSGNTRAHFYGKAVLSGILAKKACIGIRIYYAIDDGLNPTLLLIGADGKGNNLLPTVGVQGKNSPVDLMNSSVLSSFAGTEGDSIPAVMYHRWVATFNAANPQTIQAHFFGHEIVEQILSQNGCIGIRMYPALNDSGVPQLLLVGVDILGQNLLPTQLPGGRVADGGNSIADMSFPCPSYCSGT